MYTQYFRLSHAPFSIAPDPRYVYMSDRHREALAHLLYGIEGGGGFVLLTGEIGAGKTTICRCFLEQVPASCNVAYIFNPKLSVIELLRTICEEFHIELPMDGTIPVGAKEHVDALNSFLLAAHAAGRNNVLIIDEAQNLSADVLEQLRLLTNLETSERKLLQIILIGQPELRAMLERPELEQLAQRVIARYHLGALTEAETAGYIAHRLAIAGLASASPFRPGLVRAIHRATHGVPRRINLLCDRALLGAYAENRTEVDRRILGRAAEEVFGNGRQGRHGASRWKQLLAGAAVTGVAAAAVAWNIQASHGGKSAAGLQANAQPVNAAAVSASSPAKPVAVAANVTAAAPTHAVDTSSPAIDPHDAQAALRELARMWKVTLGDAAPACDAAVEHDLQCYAGTGGVAELRQLDRPAVLSLRDEAGQPYYGILTALTNSEATLRVGTEVRTLGLVALAREFDGSFTTWWRAPRAYRPRVVLGDHGEDVDWVARQIAWLVEGRQIEPGPDTRYDAALARKVREFQVAQGLKADGMIGPRTIMQMNRASGIEEPRLLAAPSIAATGK
jgi:general secretion pathway protein A